MSKLTQLSKVKRDFLRFEVWGIGDELANELVKNGVADYEPLVIVGAPPDATFIMESKMMTQFLSHHIKDFNDMITKIKSTTDDRLREKMVKQMESNMSSSVLDEFENPADIFTKTTQLGKDYLLHHTEYGFYLSEPDKRVPLRFTETEDDRQALLADVTMPKGMQVLVLNILSQDDLASIGTALLEGKTKRTPIAQIPIKTDEKGGESSIAADELGKFPVTLG